MKTDKLKSTALDFLIEQVIDEYMRQPSGMSAMERLKWIEGVCERVAQSARKEERSKVNQIFNETKKNYDYFLPPSGQAMFWEDFGNRIVKEFSNNQS